MKSKETEQYLQGETIHKVSEVDVHISFTDLIMYLWAKRYYNNVSKGREELPWQSSGYNSAPAMQGLWVQFLVGELRRFHVLFKTVKKKKKDRKQGRRKHLPHLTGVNTFSCHRIARNVNFRHSPEQKVNEHKQQSPNNCR